MEGKETLLATSYSPAFRGKKIITVLLQRDEQIKHGKQQKSFSHGGRGAQHLHLIIDVILERSAVPQ